MRLRTAVLPGRVARVIVRLGETVQKGAVVVELDDNWLHCTCVSPAAPAVLAPTERNAFL
jgi:phosphotransferase system IIA component